MQYSLRNDLILACWRKRRVRLGEEGGLEENIVGGKCEKGGPVTWPHLPLCSLPAFSLLRVTLLARSLLLIGSTPLSSTLIGWRKSLLHYRYMATALPAIRGMIEKGD